MEKLLMLVVFYLSNKTVSKLWDNFISSVFFASK